MTAISGQNLIICILRGNHDPGPGVTGRPSPCSARVSFLEDRQHFLWNWSKVVQTLRNSLNPQKYVTTSRFFVGCMRSELPKLGPGCHYPSKRLGYNVEFRMHRQFEPKFAAIVPATKNWPLTQRAGNKKARYQV